MLFWKSVSGILDSLPSLGLEVLRGGSFLPLKCSSLEDQGETQYNKI